MTCVNLILLDMNEFDFIRNLKYKRSLNFVGDDCAILPKNSTEDLLISSDALVEEIDFRLDWASPEFIGHRALAVSLSDIAAMGGKPTYSIVAIGLPTALWQAKFMDRFYDGWFELASKFEVTLVGGDISRTPAKVFIDSVVIGEVPTGKAILRSGAEAGHSIYVTGPLGGSAAGLRKLVGGERFNPSASDPLIEKHLRPMPQVQIGQQLRKSELVSSMIDLSDGLSSDLAHICRASGVGARIYANDIPFSAELMEFAGSVDVMLDLTLNGGEDFELLFTSPEPDLGSRLALDIFRIGEITPNSGVIELEREGKTELLPPGGFHHF